MDLRLIVKRRLRELNLDQKDLASAVGVTDSYISQLLTRKKLPPTPERTGIYARMAGFLKLPAQHLSQLAEHERLEEMKKKLPDSPRPLFPEVRELVLRKCVPASRKEIRAIFERQPFGELERLATQKLLDISKRVAREELESEAWLKLVAQLSGRSYQEVRVGILKFLETDVLHISAENCIWFLDPLVDSWDLDLSNFGIEIVLNRTLTHTHLRKLRYVETEMDRPPEEEPGLQEFLRNPSLCSNATEEELEFFKSLRLPKSRPTAIFYYRQLQNLRDPLNFRESSSAPLHKYREAGAVEKQMQIHARHGAIKRWASHKSPATAKRRRPKAARS